MYSSSVNLRTGLVDRAYGRAGRKSESAFNLLPLIVMTLSLVSCTGGGPLLSPAVQQKTLPDSVELAQTPFFPQEDYQCGPAALATVLTDSGVDVTPDDLVAKVYIPGRRGSLQIELLAATSDLGRLPYVIQPELSALMAEVAAGRPVLVLQNLGLNFAPVWHYAVVAGYDAATDHLVLRSGIVERRLTSAKKFTRTWAASDNWAMVSLRPGHLPAIPIQANYLQAAAALERVGRVEAAATAYRAAVNYWPESTTALFGLANAYYSAGDLVTAERTYRLSLEREPENTAVRNNLAHVLLDQGRCTDALEEIGRALGQPNPYPELLDALTDTRDAINARCIDNRPAEPTGT